MLEHITKVIVQLEFHLAHLAVIENGCLTQIHDVSKSPMIVPVAHILEDEIIGKPRVKNGGIQVKDGEHIISHIEFISIRIRIGVSYRYIHIDVL